MAYKTLTFVTGNDKKVEEVRATLGSTFPLEIISRRLYLPEVQGDIDEVSIKKCQAAARLLRTPVLVENTSLCFNALNGLPGPCIKRFLKKLKPEDLTKLLAGWEDKSAEAVCTLAYCAARDECIGVILFQGRIKGTIVAPRGNRGIGWDSIFQPDNSDRTYGEIPKYERIKISHRYKALENMRKYFIRHYV